MSFQADAFQAEGAYQTDFSFWVTFGQQTSTWAQQAPAADALWVDYAKQATDWLDS